MTGFSLGSNAADSPVPGEFAGWSRQRDLLCLLLIGLTVIAANGLYLAHVFNPNPINVVSNLGTNVVNGPAPGRFFIDPNVGYTAQALGHRSALNMLHLRSPWWNPYEGIGTPLAGEMNSGALFPPNVLLALSTGPMYLHVFLEAVAGIATYLLLRRLRLSRLTSTAGGIAFALNGTFAWLFHSPGNPVAFLPLALLGVEIILSDVGTRRWRGSVVLAVALALSLYAGFPETAFLDGLLIALWVLVRAVQLRRTAWKGFVWRIGTGTVAGLLLALPILVAFVDYLQHASVGGHGGTFAHYTEPGTSMPPFLLPYVYGPIFAWFTRSPGGPESVFWGSAGGYFGAALCLFALVGVVGRRDRALRIALATWVLVGMARTFGVGPFLALLNLIPGVKSTAFFRYAPVSWELAVIVLAAFGLEEVMARRSLKQLLVAGGAIVLAALIAYRGAQPGIRDVSAAPHVHSTALAALAWTILVAICICGIAYFAPQKARRAALGAVLVIDAFAMFIVPEFSAPRSASVDTKPVSFLVSHLGIQRFYTLGPLAPDYGSYYGIASVAINDLPIPKAYGKYINEHLDANTDPPTFTGFNQQSPTGPSAAAELMANLAGYREIGVKYVLASTGTQIPAAPDGTILPRVFTDGQVDIFQVPGALPLFQGAGCTFRSVTWNSAAADCSRATSVVRRELSMPGWTAQVNGHTVPVGETQGVFQQIRLPAGASQVSFSFSPPHINLAYLGFAVGCLMVLAPVALRRPRTQKRALGTAAVLEPTG